MALLRILSSGYILIGVSTVIISNTGIEKIISRICISQFKQEMKEANKRPPKGMDSFTCKCFLENINKGISIDLAKTTCKEKATKQFIF